MQYTRKTIYILALCILFVFIGKRSSAQYPGMQAVYNNMNRQFMNQQMQMTMMMGRYGNQLYNPKYIFQVVLKDSTKKEVISSIYTDTTLHKSYLLLIDKRFRKSDALHREEKIYSDQTISITRTRSSGYLNNPIPVQGMATDSCWLFKAISGDINAYSCLSEQDNQYFSPATIVGIQLNNGPIVKFNEENLKRMVEQDVDALEFIKKKKYYKAIKKHNSKIEKAEKK